MSVEITVTDSGVVIDVSPSGIGVVGVGIPTGGTTGQVLTKTSATNYAVAWQTPSAGALANNWTTLGANITLSAGNWADALSLTLSAGTWLLLGNATAAPGQNQRDISVRLFNSTASTTLSSTSMHAQHNNEPHGLAATAIVTLALSSVVKLQLRCESSGTVYANSEGLGNTSTTLAAVQIG
jgi:hypothetical protein